MKTVSLVMMSIAVVGMTGCGESKLDEIERRTMTLLEKNPSLRLANAEIKNLDVEYKGHDDRWGDKYSGLLEVERDGKTVMFALDITVHDETVDNVIVNGEKGEPIEMKGLEVHMEEVKE